MGYLQSKPNNPKRMRSYLTSLCNAPNLDTIEAKCKGSTKYEQIPTFNSSRNKRMTFLLDRVLVKLTRKNLTPNNYANKSGLTAEFEQHLATRISSLSVVQFHGLFSDALVNSVPLGLKTMQNNRKRFSHFSEGLLVKANHGASLRRGTVDAVVLNKTSNSIKLIENTLNRYRQGVPSFVFLVDKDVEASDYHELFVVYKESFMFEVEKIMVMNECAASIIYASSKSEFLNISKPTLTTFLTQQIANVDSEANQTLLATVITKLLDAEFEVQTANIIGELLSSPSQSTHLQGEFISQMMKRYPKSAKVIMDLKEMSESTAHDERRGSLPKFQENTPQFKTWMQKLQQNYDAVYQQSQPDKMFLYVSFKKEEEQDDLHFR